MTDRLPPLFYLETVPSQAVTCVSSTQSTAAAILLRAIAPRVHARTSTDVRFVIDTDSRTMGWTTGGTEQTPLDMTKEALAFLFDQSYAFHANDTGMIVLTDPSRMIIASHRVWDRTAVARLFQRLECSDIRVDSSFGQALLAAQGMPMKEHAAARVMLFTSGQRFHAGSLAFGELSGSAAVAKKKGLSWIVLLVGAVKPDVLRKWSEFVEIAGPDSIVLCAPTTHMLIETLRSQLSLLRSRRVRDLSMHVTVDPSVARLSRVVRLTPIPREITLTQEGFSERQLELGDVSSHEWLIELDLVPTLARSVEQPILALDAQGSAWDESDRHGVQSVAHMHLTRNAGEATPLKRDVFFAQQLIDAYAALGLGNMDLASACFGASGRQSMVSIVNHLTRFREPSQ